MTDHNSIKFSPENKANLRQALITYFNEEEIKTLCFDLDLDYEKIPGTEKESKARELIRLVERMDYVHKFVSLCQETRPSVDWNQFIKIPKDPVLKQQTFDDNNFHNQDEGNKRMEGSKKSRIWKPQVWWVFPIIVALIACTAAFVPLIINLLRADDSNQPSQATNTFDYPVRVQSRITGDVIANAIIIIEVSGQAPLSEITDSNGFSRVFVDSNRANKPARLIVNASGYQQYTKNIDLREGILPDIIPLELATGVVEKEEVSTVPEFSHTPITPIVLATNMSDPPTQTNTPVPTITPSFTPTPTATPTITPFPSVPTIEIGYEEERQMVNATGKFTFGIDDIEFTPRGAIRWNFWFWNQTDKNCYLPFSESRTSVIDNSNGKQYLVDRTNIEWGIINLGTRKDYWIEFDLPSETYITDFKVVIGTNQNYPIWGCAMNFAPFDIYIDYPSN